MPFRDFIGGKYGRDLQSSQMYLAKEVLAEIPDQVTGYMKANNVHPKPPQVVSDNNATITQGYGFSTGTQNTAPPVQTSAPPPTQSSAPPSQHQAPYPMGGANMYAPPSQQNNGAPYPGQHQLPAGGSMYGQHPSGQPNNGGAQPPPYPQQGSFSGGHTSSVIKQTHQF